MATKANERHVPEWIETKDCKVRAGQKAPWYEMVVTTKDGREVKLIAKKVDRFYSEKDEARDL